MILNNLLITIAENAVIPYLDFFSKLQVKQLQKLFLDVKLLFVFLLNLHLIEEMNLVDNIILVNILIFAKVPGGQGQHSDILLAPI